MAFHGSGENIGKLLNRKHIYFVPFRQDNPITKPRSIAFNPKYIKKTLEYALDYINSDELVEVTPTNIRLRKRILNTETSPPFLSTAMQSFWFSAFDTLSL